MVPKARTPEELAKKKTVKKTYSFSLERENIEKLAEMAEKNDLPVSELVDEAVRYYLEAVTSPKK